MIGLDGQVIDATERGRFELAIGGHVAFAQYRRGSGVLTITRVETPPSFRGQGVAGRLMKSVLEQARETGMKVEPLCSYADAYVRRHPEYADLMVSGGID